jgi:hypothetical protein
MNESSTQDDLFSGMALASMILGSVGLLLAVLPVLGLPLAGCGLAFGLVGLLHALVMRRANLWAPILGLGLSGVALAIALAIAQVPTAEIVSVPSLSAEAEPTSPRPYVSPPD